VGQHGNVEEMKRIGIDRDYVIVDVFGGLWRVLEVNSKVVG